MQDAVHTAPGLGNLRRSVRYDDAIVIDQHFFPNLFALALLGVRHASRVEELATIVSFVQQIERLIYLVRQRVAAGDFVGDDDARRLQLLGDAHADDDEHGLAHLRAAAGEHLRNVFRRAQPMRLVVQVVPDLEHVLGHVEEALVQNPIAASLSLFSIEAAPHLQKAIVRLAVLVN